MMRRRFVEVTGELLRTTDDVVAVLADISVATLAPLAPPDRLVNVGIREQAMIGVAAGLALEGFRPIVHSYAPFLVQRPYEQLKLDLGHQGVGAILVSIGASHDAAGEGRTHQAPEDVANLAALPGWTVHVPGHPDEVDRLLRAAAGRVDAVYIRLSARSNQQPHTDGLVRIRSASDSTATILAVGPMLAPVLEASGDLPVDVLYTSTPHPLDGSALADAVTTPAVIVAEPYLEGTSAHAVSSALAHRPHRLLSIGVGRVESRRYGSAADHDRLHGLDPRSLRTRITNFLHPRGARPEGRQSSGRPRGNVHSTGS
jgi:transketolase